MLKLNLKHYCENLTINLILETYIYTSSLKLTLSPKYKNNFNGK